MVAFGVEGDRLITVPFQALDECGAQLPRAAPGERQAPGREVDPRVLHLRDSAELAFDAGNAGAAVDAFNHEIEAP